MTSTWRSTRACPNRWARSTSPPCTSAPTWNWPTYPPSPATGWNARWPPTRWPRPRTSSLSFATKSAMRTPAPVSRMSKPTTTNRAGRAPDGGRGPGETAHRPVGRGGSAAARDRPGHQRVRARRTEHRGGPARRPPPSLGHPGRDRGSDARGAALAGTVCGPGDAAVGAGPQRHRPGDDLPHRSRRGHRRRAAATDVDRSGRRSGRILAGAVQRPPGTAPVHLHLDDRRPGDAATADGARAGADHQRRAAVDPGRRVLLPARRGCQGATGDLLRRLSGLPPGRAHPGRAEGPRPAVAPPPGYRANPAGLEIGRAFV